MTDDPFETLYASLEERYLSSLTFREVRKSVQALSTLYVQRRSKLGSKSGLDSAGKRAAFGLYFAPLHFLAVRHVVRALEYRRLPGGELADMGCGTGTAGAAWALEVEGRPRLLAVDRNRWAADETRWLLAAMGLRAEVMQADVMEIRLPRPGCGLLCAYTANELPPDERTRLMRRLAAAVERGACVLLVEPISTAVSGWMSEWEPVFRERGGRSDEWRFRPALPERLALLDRAAGLNHRNELTCRTLSAGIDV